jgi:acyl-CoA thioester hydrolase
MTLPFRHPITVRYRDTDSQGHMYFANYLVMADEVLSLYWRDLGWAVESVEAIPCLTFAVNATIDWLDECLAFDTLEVALGFTRLGNSSADTSFELHNLRTQTLAARGRFTHVFVDKAARRSCPIPTDFRAAIVARQPELA